MSQRKVRILNSLGSQYTSGKQAVRYLKSGEAEMVDDWTIRMLDEHERRAAVLGSVYRSLVELPGIQSDTRAPGRPDLGRVTEFVPDTFTGQTYLHYPQPGSFKRAA